MNYKINNLLISQEELSYSSGIQTKDIYLIIKRLSPLKVISNKTVKIFEKKILIIKVIFPLFWIALLFIFVPILLQESSHPLVLLIGCIFLLLLFPVSTVYIYGSKRFLDNLKITIKTISKYQHFYKLYIQVQNFNTLVDTINAINISEDSGGSNKLQDKDKVYSILKTLRADLILALNIERNFSNNPHFSFNEFEINNLETSLFNIQEECNKYGKTLSQAIQISINVAEEMQKLNSYK